VLALCAERMRLGDFVLLSEAEREAGGSARSSILSDTFEAVIGAIYLDAGLEEARRFARERLLDHAGEILQDESLSNYKSLLQERVQARFKTHPRYRVVSETGPDHRKIFQVEVQVRGRLLGRGSGHNKKEAEQMAARDALGSADLRGSEPVPPGESEAPGGPSASRE
jgi:ribonuclease-3